MRASGATGPGSAASPLSTATDPEPSPAFGQIPSSPYRLGFREWIAVFKRAIKQFLADDCIGLSAQIAFSALLAFFPLICSSGLGLARTGATRSATCSAGSRRPR
jgi:hypothetical protein